jgi:hypothetical protein
MVNLRKDLKTGEAQIEFDLDQDELMAMGRVTAQWAYLEHGVYAVTFAMARAADVELPKDALSTSFKRRLTAMRLMIEEFETAEEQKRWASLLGKIANAEQDRHKITHAMWDWDISNPERISASSFRPGFEFEKAFDAKAMHALADRIGKISFSMEYPEGWDAAIREMLEEAMDEAGNVAFGGISRQLAREWTKKKDQGPQASDPAKPQAGKHLPPS